MENIGILAYGSLIDNPEEEIDQLIKKRIKNIQTPFNIEFARKSKKRGYGPTLIPVDEGGALVNAQILVLNDIVTEQEAKDMLWRRETGEKDTDKGYIPIDKPGMNKVIIEELKNFNGLDIVFYTKIGKNIEPLNANELARLAIESVKLADENKDGITYLINAINNGISTPLMVQYKQKILDNTDTTNLKSAFIKIKNNNL